MSEKLAKAFTNLKIQSSQWRFTDLRIDIPAASFGSDAIILTPNIPTQSH